MTGGTIQFILINSYQQMTETSSAKNLLQFGLEPGPINFLDEVD